MKGSQWHNLLKESEMNSNTYVGHFSSIINSMIEDAGRVRDAVGEKFTGTVAP